MNLFDGSADITAEDLRRFDAVYRESKSAIEVPDGRYGVRVEDVGFSRSSNGNPMIVWRLRITGPQHTDRLLWKRRAITENTMAFVKEELELCGLELRRFSDLPNETSRLVGVQVDVVKRTKDNRYDIFFARPRAMTAAAGVDSGGDDLPF